MWIRSQNRKVLINAQMLDINDTRIFVSNGQKIEKSGICVGKYESEERAIEVLDEIQNEISNCVEFAHTTESLPKSEGNISNTSTSYIVYQMPER